MDAVLDGFNDNELPVDAIWADIDYLDDYKIWTNDPVKWPLADFSTLIEKAHAQEKKVVTIVDSGIRAEPGYATFDRLQQKQVFIQDPTTPGAPYLGKVWPRVAAFTDWRHPQAQEFWTDELQRFHDGLAIDGMWLDMDEIESFCDGRCSIDFTVEDQLFGGDANSLYTCECLTQNDNHLDDPPFLPGGGVPPGNCRTSKAAGLDCGTLSMAAKHYPYDSSTELEYNMHSLHGHMICKASYNALRDVRAQQRPFILTRSAWVGTGHYAAHWLGDNSATWDDMKMATPAILTFSLFGIDMVGADICGFSGDTTVELCTRWMQVGAWYPFFRNHNAKGALDQEPFRMGNMVLEASRHAINTRMSLTLYFYNLFHAASTQGGTVARPLSFEFPDDTSTWDIDTQFMVGPALMVSPALEKGATHVDVQFPVEDTLWYDYWTGMRMAIRVSPSAPLSVTLSVPATLGSPMPVHMRGGQIVARQDAGLSTAATVGGAIELVLAMPSASSGNTGGTFASTRIVRDVSTQAFSPQLGF